MPLRKIALMSAAALFAFGTPAIAQMNMNMPGMQMPEMKMPAPKKKGSAKKKAAPAKKGAAAKKSAKAKASAGKRAKPNSKHKMGSMPGMGATAGTTDVTERVEGRIAFLKAELEITDKQLPDWTALAESFRSGRQHLIDARKLLSTEDTMNSADRLDHYERHLAERLEAVKSARTAFNRLYATLSDAQKQTADTILLPLIATF